MIKILYDNFGYDFIAKKYLEVGCGTGGVLCNLISWGIYPENMQGNDIFLPSLETAKKRLPESVKLQAGNFLDCKYDEKFDVIIFKAILTSIKNLNFQIACMKYAYDLLNEGGIVLICDFIFDNLKNRDVKGLCFKTLIKSLPWSAYKFNRVTLAPPLARRLEKTPFLIKLLSALKIFDTHKIGYLKK